jgi:SSS family solute:Na+ symporter
MPWYFRGELVTVYELLQTRFGASVKALAASLFVVMRTIADGVRLLLTAYRARRRVPGASASATRHRRSIDRPRPDHDRLHAHRRHRGGGVDRGGAARDLCRRRDRGRVVVLRRDVGLGLEARWRSARRRQVPPLRLLARSHKTYTFWSGLIGGTFLTLSTHGTDQYLVQRYLCTDRPRSAAKALLASAAVVLVQFALFLFIGVLLFAFYSGRGRRAGLRARSGLPALHRPPPAGRALGTRRRRHLAAAMSSSLNADRRHRRRRPLTRRRATTRTTCASSRIVTVLAGVAQIAVGLAMQRTERSALDTVLSIASLINGPILGVFFLGATKRGDDALGAHRHERRHRRGARGRRSRRRSRGRGTRWWGR